MSCAQVLRFWNDDSVIIAADAAFSGLLRFHVSASNLPDPIEVSYAVRLVERDAEWDDPVIVERLRDCHGGKRLGW